MGNSLLGEKSVHEYMAVPQIPQESIGQSPSNAQSLSLSKGLVIPMSHDENVHHVDSHNPYRVPPPASKAKPILTTEKLYDPVDPLHFPGTKSPLARAACYMASDTCLACEVPNRYMVHVINSILSCFPKLMYHVMSLGNLIYFRRLYLMCLRTCSMKPIFLVTVVTILPIEQF